MLTRSKCWHVVDRVVFTIWNKPPNESKINIFDNNRRINSFFFFICLPSVCFPSACRLLWLCLCCTLFAQQLKSIFYQHNLLIYGFFFFILVCFAKKDHLFGTNASRQLADWCSLLLSAFGGKLLLKSLLRIFTVWPYLNMSAWYPGDQQMDSQIRTCNAAACGYLREWMFVCVSMSLLMAVWRYE